MDRHCRRCERLGRVAWKPEEEFPRDKNHSTGHARYCKLCNRELAAAWRAEHPGETEAQKQWRLEHREKRRAGGRAHYARHRTEIRERENARRREERNDAESV